MANENDKNDLTIIVTTCSSFSDLWENYLFLANKNWPDHPSIIFVSDSIPKQFCYMSNQIWSFNGNYSFRLKSALDQIRTKYVLLTMDDYLLKNRVKEGALIDLIRLMENKGFDYCRLYHKSKTKPWFDKKKKIKILPLNERRYEVNLYTSLWKTASLVKLIEKDEDPWKFEVRLTRRCRTLNYKCIACVNKKIYPFIDTVRKGKYLRNAFRFLKKNQLFISSRKKRTVLEDMYLGLKTLIADIIPTQLHDWLIRNTKISSYSRYEDEN